ncbi:P1 family peptidase [Gudongella sp. DL1XJH-153]|uniref:P1 family peptidase n=1 Tax=Gudongella sp. DL1XJH-153 TaxID=3409804 RepID=UPI003BB56D09
MSLPENTDSLQTLIGKGPGNVITDVPGVKIGHYTYMENDSVTGITSIIPAQGNVFREKLVASAHVINGFGKSAGILQLQELGSLETPILLTNTFAVGTGYSALVKYMLQDNPDIGNTTGTINPVVCECNDSKINNIRSLLLEEEHMLEALGNAGKSFQQGDIGAGTGMVCYGLKGGIGSSSRTVKVGNSFFNLGVLVLSNFGSMEDLSVYGKPIGKEIKNRTSPKSQPDKGSIIVVLATDIPLDSRQLTRVLKRTQSGIARTGAYSGNGSGEIAIGFSTANRIDHYSAVPIVDKKVLHEDFMDMVFLATVQATEESIINSMLYASPAVDRYGKKIYSLHDFKDIFE